MLVFISKYELRILITDEHQFHDRDIKLLYCRKQSFIIKKIFLTKLQLMVFIINVILHFNLRPLEYRAELIISLFTV
jgi:hypothetical protein